LKLGDRLHMLGGSTMVGSADFSGGAPAQPIPSCSVEEAVDYCEKALPQLEDLQTKCEQRGTTIQNEKQVREQLESQVRAGQTACLRLLQRVRGISGAVSPRWPQPVRLEDAVALCEAALVPLEETHIAPSCLESPPEPKPARFCLSPRVETADTAARGAPLLLSEQRGHDEELTVGWHGSVLADALQQRSRGKCCRASFGCGSCPSWVVKRKRWIIGIVSLAVVVLVGVIVRLCILPAAAQSSLNATKLSFQSAVMSEPTETGVRMKANVVIHMAGLSSALGADAHIHGFSASLGSGGKMFASCDLPALTASASVPTSWQMDARLRVHDPVHFRSAVLKVMQGESSTWSISAKPQVTSMGMTFNLEMSQDLQIPGISLEQMVTSNIDLVKGSQDSLQTSATTSFMSPSQLELRNLGKTTFALHVLDESAGQGRIVTGQKIGEVSMEDFSVRRGFNLVDGVGVTLIQSTSSATRIAKLLSDYASGKEQRIVIQGPVLAAAPWLLNVTTQVATMPGLPKPIVRSGVISDYLTIHGHMPNTGKACSLTQGEKCFRGSIVGAANFASRDLTMREMSFDVFTADEINYDVTIRALDLVPLKTARCSGKHRSVTRLFSTPGMWTFIDPERSQDATVTMPSTKSKTDGVTSFFLPAKPMPGQSDGTDCLGKLLKNEEPYDCCYLTVLTAAACYYRQKDLTVIPVSIEGNYTLSVDEFNIRTNISQAMVPLNFGHGIEQFADGPLTLSCQDFTFH